MKLTKQYLKQIILEEINKITEGDVIDASDRFGKSTNAPSSDDSEPSGQVTDIQPLSKINSLTSLANDLKSIPRDTHDNKLKRKQKMKEIFSAAKEIENLFRNNADKESLFNSFVNKFPTSLWPREYAGYSIDKNKKWSEQNDLFVSPSLVTAIVLKKAGVSNDNLQPMIDSVMTDWMKKATKGKKAPRFLPGFDETY